MSIDAAVQPLVHRRTKIVATLGPATDRPDAIAALIGAGANVFRLNMSHGTQDGHRRAFEHVRAAATAADVQVAVFADLAGPKIRVGTFADGPIELTAGERVTVTTRDVQGQPGLIPSRYRELAHDVAAGARILLADGVMELRVEAVDGTEIACTVVEGGLLGDRKGINLPGVAVTAPSLTDKDRGDAAFALELGVDYLALSFVRSAADVAELKALIAGAGHETPVIAKIERPEAVDACDEILEIADAIMVARGDLGVELPPEQVPIAQRLLVDRARTHHRPVIVATQMLESMIELPRPTRAEVADVSHAAFLGADAIMLSAETATGRHPTGAVGIMDRICRQAEGYLWNTGAFASFTKHDEVEPPIPFGDAIARATALMSRDLRARAIVVLSERGTAAITLSSARPAAPVIAVSTDPATCRRANLMWGVIPRLATTEALEDPVRVVRERVIEAGVAQPGQHVVLVRGFHDSPSITLITV